MGFRTFIMIYLAIVIIAYFVILIIYRTIPPIITIPLLLQPRK